MKTNLKERYYYCIELDSNYLFIYSVPKDTYYNFYNKTIFKPLYDFRFGVDSFSFREHEVFLLLNDFDAYSGHFYISFFKELTGKEMCELRDLARKEAFYWFSQFLYSNSFKNKITPELFKINKRAIIQILLTLRNNSAKSIMDIKLTRLKDKFYKFLSIKNKLLFEMGEDDINIYLLEDQADGNNN